MEAGTTTLKVGRAMVALVSACCMAATFAPSSLAVSLPVGPGQAGTVYAFGSNSPLALRQGQIAQIH
jgi:hypothetical protein